MHRWLHQRRGSSRRRGPLIDESQVEIDEVGHLGFGLHDGGIRVDEQGTSQGVLGAIDGLQGGFDTLQGEDTQYILVLVVIGIAEEADGVGAADDTLDEDVIVFAQLGFRSGEDGFSGPLGAHIHPGLSRAEDKGQLFEGDIRDEIVLLADGDGYGVGADTELNRFTADGLAGIDFAVLDGAGSVGDVGVAGD
jgi:hypothetical protein